MSIGLLLMFLTSAVEGRGQGERLVGGSDSRLFDVLFFWGKKLSAMFMESSAMR